MKQAREEAYKFIILLQETLCRAIPIPELRDEIDAALLRAEEPRDIEVSLLECVKRFSRLVNEFREQDRNVFVEKALRYIDEHIRSEISLGSIAPHIQVSPYYLSKLFRKYTGKTCTDIITERRIEEAKKLLVAGKSSKESCYGAGFNSQNYFSKIFKKITGFTPGEYRTIHAASSGTP
jgi:two-component system response regulator YesN